MDAKTRMASMISRIETDLDRLAAEMKRAGMAEAAKQAADLALEVDKLKDHTAD